MPASEYMLNVVWIPNIARMPALMNPAFGAASATQASAVIRFEIISGVTAKSARIWRPGASVRETIQARMEPNSTDSVATSSDIHNVLMRAVWYVLEP